uniref:Uncharacterized protein n=1 Tax=Arundo donax TaxID=35708 RepID=A0A0A9A8E2_ARUDO
MLDAYIPRKKKRKQMVALVCKQISEM